MNPTKDITIPVETYNRLCAENQAMREALERIRDGMADDRTYRDAARAALKGE